MATSFPVLGLFAAPDAGARMVHAPLGLAKILGRQSSDRDVAAGHGSILRSIPSACGHICPWPGIFTGIGRARFTASRHPSSPIPSSGPPDSKSEQLKDAAQLDTLLTGDRSLCDVADAFAAQCHRPAPASPCFIRSFPLARFGYGQDRRRLYPCLHGFRRPPPLPQAAAAFMVHALSRRALRHDPHIDSEQLSKCCSTVKTWACGGGQCQPLTGVLRSPSAAAGSHRRHRPHRPCDRFAHKPGPAKVADAPAYRARSAGCPSTALPPRPGRKFPAAEPWIRASALAITVASWVGVVESGPANRHSVHSTPPTLHPGAQRNHRPAI